MPICKTGFYKWLKINNLTLFSGSQNSGTIHIIKILIDGMDNSDTINILCATDENYAPYCGIMLTSLFENNRDCHFNVFVFEDGSLTEENVKKYHLLAKKYGNEIVLKTIDESMVKGFPTVEGWVTLPTYYRLLAAEFLPTEIHKVIYFDCDIIVCGDLRPLWDVDLMGEAVAVCKDCDSDYHCERLCLGSYSYFNAGVMVIDLDYWRKYELSAEFKKYVFSHSYSLLLKDQDVLNGVCFDKKVWLPERYNFMVSYFFKPLWDKYSDEERFLYFNESNNAIVLHYAVEKPWNYWSYGGPFFSVWNNYRKKSSWRNYRIVRALCKHYKYFIIRHVFPQLFRNIHRSKWVVLPENSAHFHYYVT